MIKKDEFLSEILGKSCYECLEPRNEIYYKRGFYYIKNDYLYNFDGWLGFYLISIELIFEFEIWSKFKYPPLFKFDITKDVIPVLNIAEKSFTEDRFHKDPYISESQADTIKREWVKNVIEKRYGDNIFIVKDKEVVSGFLTSKIKDDTAIIDLIAVDSNYRGSEFATWLICTFLNYYYSMGYKKFRVGTQLSNIASTRLYEKCGFRLKESRYIYHKHVN